MNALESKEKFCITNNTVYVNANTNSDRERIEACMILIRAFEMTKSRYSKARSTTIVTYVIENEPILHGNVSAFAEKRL